MQLRKAYTCPLELRPIARHGVQGEMTSAYLRDPDDNLIELCCYE